MRKMNKPTVELVNKFEILKNYYNAGQYEVAHKKIKLLMKQFPNIPILYNLFGLILTKLEKTQESIGAYKTALRLNPKMAIAHNNLGNIYYRILNEITTAKENSEKAITIDPRFAIAFNNLGNLYRDLNQSDQSINCFKKAIELEPKLYVAYKNLGTTYSSAGDFKTSINFFHKAMEIEPNFLEPHREISLLTKYEKNNEHLVKMEKLFENSNLKDDNKMHLAMALGKAYEDIKQYKKSFEKYHLGNSLKRKSFKYDIKSDEKIFETIKSNFGKKLFEKFNDTGYKKFSPIFIVGMPRSGTTLIEQILSSHPNVYGAGELTIIQRVITNFSDRKPLKFFEGIEGLNQHILYEMGESYEKITRSSFKFDKFLTDKLPHNFLFIGLIKIILPTAKIIHCDRDARDNCFSIFKNFFAGSVLFGYDLKELGQYHNLYKDLMKHWKNTIPEFIYDISYEKLVNNLEIETKKLLKFCNLNWNANCLKFHKNNRSVNTASLSQVRQPIYKSSIKTWEHYKDDLKPMLSLLK